MTETFFKTLIVIAIIIIVFYLVFSSIKKFGVLEGLENMQTKISGGETSGSASFAAQIKAEVIRMQDSLLISKYRKEYESAIINLEDLINFTMLKLVLNMNTDSMKDIKNVETLNTLDKAKATLNNIMKFVDRQ